MSTSFNAIDYIIIDPRILVSGVHFKHQLVLAEKKKDFLISEDLPLSHTKWPKLVLIREHIATWSFKAFLKGMWDCRYFYFNCGTLQKILKTLIYFSLWKWTLMLLSTHWIKSTSTHQRRPFWNCRYVGKTKELWVEIWHIQNSDEARNSGWQDRGFSKKTLASAILLCDTGASKMLCCFYSRIFTTTLITWLVQWTSGKSTHKCYIHCVWYIVK